MLKLINTSITNKLGNNLILSNYYIENPRWCVVLMSNVEGIINANIQIIILSQYIFDKKILSLGFY